MKKLIAMIGAVATCFGLYATDLTKSAVSFEAAEPGCSGDTLNLEEDTMWSTDYDDVFKFGATADETTYAGAYTGTTRRNDEFTGSDENLKFLKLSTGTNSLQRLFAAEEAAVDTDPIFIDQLVKFTGYEDTQTVFAAGTKVAVWMSEFVIGEENDVEITQTNLYVAVGSVVGGNVTPKNVKIADDYQLDKWYRLTIRSIGNIVGDTSASPNALSGFAIYINGNPITIVPEDRDIMDIANALIPKAKVLYSKGQLFPSMIAGSTTLKSVGFEGMGGIDDMIVDNVGPDFAQEANFKIPELEGIDVLCVSNIDENAELIADANGYYTAIPGQAIRIYFTAQDKYVLTPDPKPYDFDAEAGTTELEITDVEAEDALMEVDGVYYADSNLDDAFAVLASGEHTAEFYSDVEYPFEVEEEEYSYTFGADTLLNTSEDADGNVKWEIEGEFGTDFGVEANKTIVVAGATTLLGEIVVAGTLQTDEIDLDENVITLGADGKVITQDGELTYENFGLDDETKLSKTGPDADEYYTYALQGMVTFTVTAPENTSVTKVVDADGEEIKPDTDNKYTAELDADITVTLTAADGYYFDNAGAKTLDVGAKAAKDNVTITLENPLVPAPVKKGLKFFITLQDAIESEEEGDITLCENITLATAVVASQDFVLDLGGKTITGPETGWAIRLGDNGANVAVISNGTINSTISAVRVDKGSSVTLDTVTIATGNRAIQLTAASTANVINSSVTCLMNGSKSSDEPAVYVTEGSTFTLDEDSTLTQTGNGATLLVFGGTNADAARCTVNVAGEVKNTYEMVGTETVYTHAICGNGNDKTAGVTLNVLAGATVSSLSATAIYFPCVGALNIGAAEITGLQGVYVKAGATAVIEGASINATGAKGDWSASTGGDTNTGDAFVVEANAAYAGVDGIAISGGTFTSANGAAVASYAATGLDRVTGFVSGGKFKGAVTPATDLIAVGPGQTAKWTPGEDGYLVPDYDTIMIAKNLTTEKEYAWGELNVAISEAEDGETIQLIADGSVEFDTAAYATIPADVSLTLDLNGKKFFASSVGQLREHKVFNIPEGCAFTIMDSATGGEVEYCETVPTDFADGAYIVKNKGTFTLTSGKLTAYGKCKGKVWGEPCWGIVAAVVNDVNSNNDDQPVVFNMTGGELNIWAHGATFEDPDKPGSTYPEYNGISGIAINQYDASDDNIINISGGVIRGGTLRSGFNSPYQTAAVKSAVVINITGGTFEGRFDIANYGATEVNIKNAKIVSNAAGAFEPWFRASGDAANQPYVTIDATTTEVSSMRFPMSFPAANVEIVGGLFDQKEKVTYATTPYYYTSGTITEDVVALKDLVPEVICTITDNETDPATYTVAKVPAALEIVKATGVASVTYTVNGNAALLDQHVVYGDVVKIVSITYADGYKAGDVEEGDEFEMTAEVMTEAIEGSTSVKIDVDATKYPVKKGGTFFITLQEALDAAGDDDVVLCDNVTADGVSVGTAYPKTYAIDMAGYTLTVSEGATLTLNDKVTLKNSVAGQGGFKNAGTIAINADQDFSNLAWGAGGFIDAGPNTSAKLAIAADATVKMPTATVDLDPNQMATVTPGFWDGTANGAKVFTAANMWKYNGETWDAAVATVAGEYYFTVDDALLAVKAAEEAGTFPIVVTALQDDLVITVGEGEAQQKITLAKGGEITIKADSWAFNPAPAITKVLLAEGKKLVFPTAIANYKTVILCADGFQVVETAIDGGFEYTVEKNRTFFGGGDGSETNPYIIAEYQHLVDLQDWVAAGNATAGVYFQQTADIDFANIDGENTAAPAWAGIGGKDLPFRGVYDGGNFKIDNMTLTKVAGYTKEQKYDHGFFNNCNEATVKNLTINCLGYDANETTTENYGGAILIGEVVDCTIENVTVEGSLVATYTAGAVTAHQGNGDGLMFVNCTNKANITTCYDKCGGFVAMASWSPVMFDGCVNEGTLTITHDGTKPGAYVADFVANSGSTSVTFKNCVAAGNLVVTGTPSPDNRAAFVGFQSADTTNHRAIIGLGNNVAPADRAVTYFTEGLWTTLTGFTYGKVDAGTATYIGTLVKDDTYVQFRNDDSETIFTLAAKDDWIAFRSTADGITLPTKEQIAVADDEALDVQEESITDGVKFTAIEKVSDITITVKKVAGIASVTVDGKALVFDDTTDEATFTVPADAPTATLTLAAVSTIKIPVYTISEGKDSMGWMVTNKTPVVTADAEKANYFTFGAEEASANDQAITDAAAATAIKEAAPTVANKVDELTTGDGAIAGKTLVNWIAAKGGNDPATALAGNYVKASVKLDVAPITETTVVKVDTVEKATSDLAVTIKVGDVDATVEQIKNFVEVCDDLGVADGWEKLVDATDLQSAVKIEEGKLVITPVAGIDKLFLKVVIPADK